MDNWKLEKSARYFLAADINDVMYNLITEVEEKEDIISDLKEKIETLESQLEQAQDQIDLLQEQLNNIE